MITPSIPFEKARSTNSRSTLPEHMTRISLVSVVYCSLETPAMSPAPYAHQWHTKPRILGLNLSAVLILSHHLQLENNRVSVSVSVSKQLKNIRSPTKPNFHCP